MYLDDEDKTILNKSLVFDELRFKEHKFHLTYERNYVKDGEIYNEYYFNDELDTYSITRRTNKKKVILLYSKEGVMFETTKIYYNRFKQAYKKEVYQPFSEGQEHYDSYLIPHIPLFENLEVIEYDYEEEEKDCPEIKNEFIEVI
jgi:hypothetical protein